MFRKRLNHLRVSNGYTLEELGKMIGVGKSAISNYETGYRYPKIEQLEALADIFNVDLDYLTGRSDIANRYKDSIRRPADVEKIVKKFTALDSHGKQVVSALLDAEYERVQDIMAASRGETVGSSGTIAVPLLQDALSRKVIGTVPVAASEKIPGGGIDLFAWRIENNAMAPRIASGDTVIVHKQDDVNSGDIAVVLLDGVQVVCKQVIKEGDKLTLVPLNNKYQTRVFKQEVIKKRFKILGKVVENIQAV